MKSGKEKGRSIRVVDGMFAEGNGGVGYDGGDMGPIRPTPHSVLKKARVHFQPQPRLRSAQQSSFVLEGPLLATGLQIYRILGCAFLRRSLR